MNLLIVSVGLCLLTVPGLADRFGRELHPEEWTRLASGSLRLGLWAVRLGLALTAAAAVSELVGARGAVEICHRFIGVVVPGGDVVGWASAGLVLAGEVRMYGVRRAANRCRQQVRVEPWLGDHLSHGRDELVVLPTSEPVAYAVGGHPAQIVVSSRLVAAFSDVELAAVVRHEQCHLRYGHHRTLTLSTLVESTLGWLPGVRRSTAALRLAIERWADESASRTPGDRQAVRTALRKTVMSHLEPVPAFAGAEHVVERLTSLERSRPSPNAKLRIVVAAPTLVLTSGLGTALLALAAHGPHGLFGVTGYCPL